MTVERVVYFVLVVVDVTSATRSSKVLTTNRGQVIVLREADPCKEGTALARRPKSEGYQF